ncbi:ATP cone domain-containing protein [Formosa sp. PL04]|uniref:ATP cone domain-containing protein n=1 Tax=Formosa sp. PL04 TaxID=3081755 RepID=UPI002982A8FC|nr:ATP cone domain-containing protein [Formosa sp. PL04]MDW5290690.1 restriction endonuclease [Formosa sp. PL04]
MNGNQDFNIIKSSGENVKFSFHKLKNSLTRSGADEETVESVLSVVKNELYQGISTKEIYNRAYSLLKNKKGVLASKYKLKKAIYELGPTGFPFEKFIGALLQYSGYTIEVDQIMQGKCVSHEVDVIAKKDKHYIVAECKFHGEEGRNCDVKIPLYINSRYQDIVAQYKNNEDPNSVPNEGWVVTNTRFTKDAIQYGKCVGLYLLSWDYPEGNSIRERIDRIGLYPITSLTLLTTKEKQFLLTRDVVLCKQLHKDDFYLDYLGISEIRKKKINNEIKQLCNE